MSTGTAGMRGKLLTRRGTREKQWVVPKGAKIGGSGTAATLGPRPGDLPKPMPYEIKIMKYVKGMYSRSCRINGAAGELIYMFRIILSSPFETSPILR